MHRHAYKDKGLGEEYLLPLQNTLENSLALM